jgi:hypothetical protein
LKQIKYQDRQIEGEGSVDTEDLLKRVEQHIFSTGLEDSGCRLGLANMKYGLAKIHWVQQEIGLDSDAIFISAPDMTITRRGRVRRRKAGQVPS